MHPVHHAFVKSNLVAATQQFRHRQRHLHSIGAVKAIGPVCLVGAHHQADAIVCGGVCPRIGKLIFGADPQPATDNDCCQAGRPRKEAPNATDAASAAAGVCNGKPTKAQPSATASDSPAHDRQRTRESTHKAIPKPTSP